MEFFLNRETPQKIDHFFKPSVERQKNKETMNTTKMNSNTNSKKIKRTCTCSTCGKSGHNASNKKFHPDYEFTGVSVPASAPKKKCRWCELWIEEWLLPGAKPVRDTKWHYESDMILMIQSQDHDGNQDHAYLQLACLECADNMEEHAGFVPQKKWLKEFGTEDPTAALAAADAIIKGGVSEPIPVVVVNKSNLVFCAEHTYGPIDVWYDCPKCLENAMYEVDQRDSPNVFPYKRCYKCDGRSSCGSYVDDDWICEGCAPEEEESEEEDDGFENCEIAGTFITTKINVPMKPPANIMRGGKRMTT